MKRLQSALEFMMTYGWAILVVIIVLATIYALGILGSATSTPNSCTFPSNIGCLNAALLPTGVLQVNLQQATSDTINVVAIGCNDQGLSNSMTPVSPPATIPTGGNATFSVQCYWTVAHSLAPYNAPIGQSFKGYLMINYTDLTTGFTQTGIGSVLQKVQ